MTRPARWILPQFDSSDVEAFAQTLGITVPAASVLYSRGIRDAATARRFLHPSLEDLYDPFALCDMDRAVARLKQATETGEKILIYGDYDVDGTTSVVILKRAIELAGGTADFHVPDRFKEGYGMRPEAVEAAARSGVSLIISVDTGIRAAEVLRRSSELSIDV